MWTLIFFRVEPVVDISLLSLHTNWNYKVFSIKERWMRDKNFKILYNLAEGQQLRSVNISFCIILYNQSVQHSFIFAVVLALLPSPNLLQSSTLPQSSMMLVNFGGNTWRETIKWGSQGLMLGSLRSLKNSSRTNARMYSSLWGENNCQWY